MASRVDNVEVMKRLRKLMVVHLVQGERGRCSCSQVRNGGAGWLQKNRTRSGHRQLREGKRRERAAQSGSLRDRELRLEPRCQSVAGALESASQVGMLRARSAGPR